MVEILFLLLPLAFYSGWRAARKHFQKQQQQQCQLSDSFVKGVNYLLSEQPDKALEVFLDYPDIDEYTVETYQLLGNMFRGRGEVDRALRVHQNLIARPNLNARQKEKAMFALGEDFLAAGMMDRAERVFQELLDNISKTKQVSKSSVCRSLRSIFEQTQEWQKAIEATRCIEEHAGKDGDNYNNDNVSNPALIAHYYCELADEALHQGNLHEVDKLMGKAQKAHKQSTRLMTLRGDVAYHQQHYKQALKHYMVAIKTDSRLLSMLFDKLEISANKANAMQSLQNDLIKLYKKNQDKSLFEVIVVLARKYSKPQAGKQGTALGKDIDQLIESELTSRKLNIESIYKATDYIRHNLDSDPGIDAKAGLSLTYQALENYLQGLPKFCCEHCGYRLHNYMWRCPACQKWDTINHA